MSTVKSEGGVQEANYNTEGVTELNGENRKTCADLHNIISASQI